jgi:hypothetical protein
MTAVASLDVVHCPECNQAQACSRVVSVFDEMQYCVHCNKWSRWRVWVDANGRVLGDTLAKQLRSSTSAITRPAVFVASEGADLFGRWASVELNRQLYARSITTLHCFEQYSGVWWSTPVSPGEWRSQVRLAAEHADCLLVTGDLRELSRLVGHDLDVSPSEAMRRKVVVVRDRATGLPPRSSPARIYNMRGRSEDEIARVVEEVWAQFSGSALVLPLPPRAVLGAIVEPINEYLIKEIACSPALLQQLNWREVEKLIAEVLAGLGHSVELQRGTKDGGVDIIAFRCGSTMDKLLKQVKHPSTGRFVGVEPVRQLYYTRSEQHATKGIIACTSGFTKGARELLDRYRWELEGRDQAGIIMWAQEYLRTRC